MKAPEKVRTLIEARKIGNRKRAIHIIIMSVILYTLILLPVQIAVCRGYQAFENYRFTKSYIQRVIGDNALVSEHVNIY